MDRLYKSIFIPIFISARPDAETSNSNCDGVPFKRNELGAWAR